VFLSALLWGFGSFHGRGILVVFVGNGKMGKKSVALDGRFLYLMGF
jgi:hypothetical protein